MAVVSDVMSVDVGASDIDVIPNDEVSIFYS